MAGLLLTVIVLAVAGGPRQLEQLVVAQPPPVSAGIEQRLEQRERGQARGDSAKTGTARIRGRIYAADNGQPLRKAQVRAFSPELRENRMATTDGTGVYELKELPAGRYTLTASKGGFINLSYGQLRPLESGKPIEIIDGQAIDRVDFALPRGSVIAGHIVDEFGDPVADAQVMAMRYQFVQGRRQLVPAVRPATTNDIGEFRLFALPPGLYYLAATLRSTMIDGLTDDRSGYAPTYYPGTPTIAEAHRISVSVGQIVSDVTLALVQTRTARVTGTAIDSRGKPLSGGFVTAIQHNGGMFMGSGGGQIRPDGSFTISNLAPGEYTLHANMTGGFIDGESESATATIVVNGDDLSGVQLVGTRSIIATGRIIVDPAQVASLQPSILRVSVMPARPDDGPMMGPGGTGTVNDDFTFQIKTRPGQRLIRLNPAIGGLGWTTKAIRYNGADVTDAGIDFRPNEDVSGIEIEVTNRSSEVSGIVTTARGGASKDYTVIIFARDSERWGWLSRWVGTARPDQDGRYKVRNLPAGEYCAIALEYLDLGEANDPEVLSRLREKAMNFFLNDGETKVLDLKIDSTP